jgi:hypothetical protein
MTVGGGDGSATGVLKEATGTDESSLVGFVVWMVVLVALFKRFRKGPNEDVELEEYIGLAAVTYLLRSAIV